jgi:hypothetical protein
MNAVSHPKWPWLSVTLTWSLVLVVGCAAPGSGSHRPRRGEGVREFQRRVLDLRKAVEACVQSADGLTRATRLPPDARLKEFHDSAQRLEVASVSARARIEALEHRGEAYFEEWAEEIAGAGDEAARSAAKDRFTELHGHFDGILKESQHTRRSFREFLEGLRETRAKLGAKRPPTALENCRPALLQVAENGRRAGAAMDQLLDKLKAAEIAVMSGPAPLPKKGGR